MNLNHATVKLYESLRILLYRAYHAYPIVNSSIEALRKYLPYAIWAAKADLGAEVASSFLNWLWWLIEPVCMMLIYTFIFGFVFKAKEDYFPIFVFTGITMWGFFSRTINGSVNTVRQGDNHEDIYAEIHSAFVQDVREYIQDDDLLRRNLDHDGGIPGSGEP